MDIKEENKDTIGRALAVGYRASRIVGTAHRRASEETAPAVLNELSRARTSLEEAIFCLEEVKGVEGSIDGSISASQEFVREYSMAIDTCVLDRYAVGTLRCGMDEAAEATGALTEININDTIGGICDEKFTFRTVQVRFRHGEVHPGRIPDSCGIHHRADAGLRKPMKTISTFKTTIQ